MDFEYVAYAFKILYVPEYILFELVILLFIRIINKKIKPGRLIRLTVLYPFLYLGYVTYDVYAYFNAREYGVSTYVDATLSEVISTAINYVVFIFVMFLVFAKMYEVMGLLRTKDANINKLKEYKEMRKARLITEDEFKKLKKETLGMEEKGDIDIVDL